MKYINVIVDIKSHNLDTPYTYSCDNDDVKIGDKVYVNFSKYKKPISGYVVEVDAIPNIDLKKIKPIESLQSDKSLNEEMIDTALWMKKRYGIRFIDGIKVFTVIGKNPKQKILKTIYEESIDGDIVLNVDQIKAKENICKSIENREQMPFLINGVTNSGKTEIYMAAIEKALSEGRNAVMLVPEIALTKQTKDRLALRFTEEKVAVLHSKLKGSEKLDEWLRLRNGNARIAIGTRSAVFAPIDNIGVIIIDEEHESTYKSDQNPKYETVDIAFKRAQHHKSVIIMGSATPSVTSTYRAKQGLYKQLDMKSRIDGSNMPEIDIVDMRDEIKRGNFTPFSRQTYKQIKDTLNKNEQVILFLNRRGFSPNIQCKECGNRITCDECGVSMVYHKSAGALVCHYCGRKVKVPNSCPECGSKYIKFSGIGTEKVEEETKRMFPDAVVERLDLDTAKKQSDVDRIISQFIKGKTNILIGTQILAKGLDFKNVGLVGIIMADLSLNIPDYRSAERTFELITQVAGRAGRGGKEGKVIIQTYTPDNYAIQTAASYDYDKFYEIEINHRKIMKYPPFSDIIVVMFMSISKTISKSNAMKCKVKVEALDGSVLYDVKATTRFTDEKKFRYYFLVKCMKGYRNQHVRELVEYRKYLTEENINCQMDIDINPYGLF
ncbi:MAG: primosomal protein N' [Clostridiales bacterium]|nr:primosomal protein N' [Clostridiales bacterium]